MHEIYDFVSGPLVWVSFIIFFGGSLYRLISMVLLARKKEPMVFEYMSFYYALRSILHWIIPFGTVKWRKNPFFTIVTFTFHICLIFVPIFLFARKRGMPLPTKRATKLVLIAGFFGMGIGSILYVNAVFFTGATVTSVIAATAPLFALPFTILFLKEKVTPFLLLGTFLTISGVWLVVLGF